MICSRHKVKFDREWLCAVSPRRKKERGRTTHGRLRKMSAGDSFSAISTGASSMSSGHLAAVGQQFESALLDSNGRCGLNVPPHLSVQVDGVLPKTISA